MRVLQVNSVCHNGSTGKLAYALHMRLIADGNESMICYGRGERLSDINCRRIGNIVQLYFDAFFTRLTGLAGFFSPFSTKQLLKYIKAYQPDVVHLHNLHGYYINIYRVMESLKRLKIPTIWTMHDEFLFTGKCASTLECHKWESGCYKCPQLHSYPSSLFLDFSRFMYHIKKRQFSDFNGLLLVAPSAWLGDRVKHSFLKDKKLFIIPNGIDSTTTFRPRDTSDLRRNLGLKDERVVLAVAPGIMSDQKGGKYAIELSRILQDENIVFILIGMNASATGRQGKLILLEKINDQVELALYYSLADLFLLCSSQETFSLTCAESLCCGTPVAGFKSGAPETVFERPFAQFVEYGDVKALEKLTLKMLDNAPSEMECRKYANGLFSEEIMYKRYREQYLCMHARVGEKESV